MARPRHQFALALEIMAQFKNSHLEHFKVTLLLELGRVQFKNQVPIREAFIKKKLKVISDTTYKTKNVTIS